jgi:RNA polymerase sigma factor (sigma-70 family)
MFNPFSEADEGGVVDAELVEQARNGDRSALEQLVLRHQAWVYNIAVRMVFHPQDAEEVAQEVMVKVITRLNTFKGESRFRTWLHRIAANHVLNMKLVLLPASSVSGRARCGPGSRARRPSTRRRRTWCSS